MPESRCHLGAITVFVLDCRCQLGVIGAHFKFESLFANSKLLFQRLQLRMLVGIKIETVMKQRMKFILRGHWRINNQPPCHYAPDC